MELQLAAILAWLVIVGLAIIYKLDRIIEKLDQRDNEL